jgi:hypothetical protein
MTGMPLSLLAVATSFVSLTSYCQILSKQQFDLTFTMAAYFVDQFHNYSNVGVHTVLVAVLVISIVKIAITWFQHSYIPGPLLCSITNLPRLLWVRTGKAHIIHIQLHEKYGNLVRLGPNNISVGDAREVSKIYGVTANLRKVSYV